MVDVSTLKPVAIYCALNVGILFWITIAIGRIRIKHQIMIGDGDNTLLAKAMRGHANAIEIIPMSLLTLLIVALLGGAWWIVHVLGLALTVGRFLHAFHFVRKDAALWQRMLGFGLSMVAMIGSALYALYLGLAVS